MWDVATRRYVVIYLIIACINPSGRGQESFKREFLEPRRPPPSPFEKQDYGKKSVVSIRRLILEASEASVSAAQIMYSRCLIGSVRWAESKKLCAGDLLDYGCSPLRGNKRILVSVSISCANICRFGNTKREA
jgi:hypothetical protein